MILPLLFYVLLISPSPDVVAILDRPAHVTVAGATLAPRAPTAVATHDPGAPTAARGPHGDGLTLAVRAPSELVTGKFATPSSTSCSFI